eukprot:4456087-Prymnesium_polylepis.1
MCARARVGVVCAHVCKRPRGASLKRATRGQTSEEEERCVVGDDEGLLAYEIAFNPLDGSSNLETNLPIGSIFGVYQHTPGSCFQGSGRKTMVAAGSEYSLDPHIYEITIAKFDPLGLTRT